MKSNCTCSNTSDSTTYMSADKQGLSDMPASFEGNLSEWKYLGAHNCLSCCWTASECQTDTSKNFAQANEIGSEIYEFIHNKSCKEPIYSPAV